ncbi:MAG: hypothetical protein F4X56_10350 [Gammaproteobacteria bacterium]|nr:hypothetical protein [Gammaproteobacteria bacterium]MXW06944.1 hypothetical protein [Gammaproteobacteria bacterium]MYC26300.1 hypothetical protein [Gammaproteobacteria bacterium]
MTGRIPQLSIRTTNPLFLPYGLLGVLLLFFVVAGWTQTEKLESVSLDPEKENDLVVIPAPEEASKSTYELDDFEIEIESKDERVKYEAREKGTIDEPIVHWEVDSDEPVHLVFDTKQKKFQRLTNKVRVVLNDYTQLESLIEETDAESGKAYPKLGYAVLELPAEKHPATFTKAVEKRAEVESAFVIVERPPEVPH